LVERQVNEADKRIMELYLTASGRAEFETILPVARRAYRKAVEGIDPDELGGSLEVIRRMLQNLGAPPFI
jgi:DNA-binding MarR family transcriptional regulator